MPRAPRAVLSTQQYDDAGAEAPDQKYVLRLFIAGTTPASTRAVEALGAICSAHLDGHYELEIIDVYQQPELARDEQILAVPTLVKKLPSPIRRIFGDLTNTPRVLVGLDINPQSNEKARRKPRKKK